MEIIGIYFLGTILQRKYAPLIFVMGLFYDDKFEETPNENVINMYINVNFTLRYVEMDGTTLFSKFQPIPLSKFDIDLF